MGAKKALEILHSAGYEAYLVGGCVRDAVMGNEINDFDITTSATPKEMQEVFKNLGRSPEKSSSPWIEIQFTTQ